MALELQLAPARMRLSTHESLRVVLRLRNRGASTLRLPFLDDGSEAVTFTVTRVQSGRVRVMSGQTGQSMLTHARIDPRPMMLELAAGAEWVLERDLGTMHYLLPAGRFALHARFVWAAEGIDLISATHEIEVEDSPPASVQVVEEPSLIDASILHLVSGPPPRQHHFVRQHTRLRPLATWYATEVEAAQGAESLAASVGDYAEAPIADALIDRQAVWLRDGRLQACRLVAGVPQGAVRSADQPAGWRWLQAASHRLDGELWLPCVRGHELGVFRFGAAAIEPLFTFDLGGAPLAVEVIDGEVHVVSDGPALAWLRLSAAGRLLQRQERARPGPEPLCQARLRVREERLALLYRDAAPGRVAHVRVLDGSLQSVGEQRIEVAADRPRLTEVAFDVSPRGQIDLLVASESGATHYINPAGQWRPFVSGQREYFPQVSSDSGRVYLGIWRSGAGFRFIEHDRHDAAFRPHETL